MIIQHSEKSGFSNESDTTNLSNSNQIPDLERRTRHEGKQNDFFEHKNKTGDEKTTKCYRGKNFHFIV